MIKTLVAAAAATALFPPFAAFAQTVMPIQIGQSLTGQLSASEPILAQGVRHECYRLVTEKGRHARVVTRPSDFDAVLVAGSGEPCTPFRETSATATTARAAQTPV